MTLEEFRTAARDWDVSDLMHFCWDNNYEDVVEDVYSSDGYDEYIGNCVSDYASNNSWQDLRDYIDGFPDPYEYDYWIEDGWGDFCGLETGNEYFDDLLDKLEEQLIADDFFDSDEDEENECVTDDSIEEDDLVISVESVSIMYGWAI